MRGRGALVWGLRAAWAVTALVAGPAFDAALDGRSGAVVLVAAFGLWGAWALGLVATLVPTTVSLTAVRLLAPAGVAAAGATALVGASAPRVGAALAVTAATAVAAATAEVGRAFVQGSAYGDEDRFPLRPPGAVLLGPLVVVWALVVAGGVAGPLLLGARQWGAGAVTLVAGVPVAVLGARRLHQLSRRWVVLVPAGLVLHDHLALADTVLFARATIAGVRLAPADTEAADVTAGAPGLAVELALTEPVTLSLAPTPRSRRGPVLHARRVLFSPSRPGAVLAACAARRLAVAPH